MEPDYSRINNTLGKMALYLGNHENILVSVSGGSDSDIIVHMIATYFREHLPRIHFVFVNTGLEYQATRDHLAYLEKRYDIKIERIRGMPIPVAVKKYGFPIISKDHSRHIKSFLNDAPTSTAKVNGGYTRRRYNFSAKSREVAYAVKERGLKVSGMCCDKSKKDPMYRYCKEHSIDLVITGEREGRRAESVPVRISRASSRIQATDTINTCPCFSGTTIRRRGTNNQRVSNILIAMKYGG